MPPSSSRIPSLLQPYIQGLPEGSLHLLTSVLGASANWLLIRYISGALGDVQPANGRRANDHDGTTAVVLVSFLRDWDFWKVEARRAAGLDLARLAQQNRFVFVDGLSSLFLPSEPENGLAKATTLAPSTGTLPVRGPRTVNPRGQSLPTHTPASQPKATVPSGPVISLTSAAIEHLESTLSSVISSLSAQGRRIHLLLDSPDLLLAATASSAPSAAVTPSILNSTILSLRAQVYAVTVAVSADTPLMGAASDASAFASGMSSTKQHTPLETRHAGLVLSLAHVADWMLSLRLLDTGFAADVSGVVRITRGDNQDEDDGEEGEESQETWEKEETKREEKELLYHVAGDGGVKVFERGAGGGAGHG
ncbi:uncharacterized protein J3D65DRAFT_667864 [Phyllosticta citribraziliensis]|uniref:Elongator complex protein 6 n=1 Tax=Phyllosticta citribraziliensis TaxID=989973 RepID=A0ABR1LT31_9PEZI